jgi:hypothetical protein
MSALRCPVLNRALSWPSGRRRRHRCRGALSPSCSVGRVECRRTAFTLPLLVPVVAAVDPSVAGQSHPMVDQNAVEPLAIKPSLQHLQLSHSLLGQYGRYLRQYGRYHALRQRPAIESAIVESSPQCGRRQQSNSSLRAPPPSCRMFNNNQHYDLSLWLMQAVDRFHAP